MSKFQIESKAGVDLGVYEGETKEAALAAMKEDGGIADEQIGTVADYYFTEV